MNTYMQYSYNILKIDKCSYWRFCGYHMKKKAYPYHIKKCLSLDGYKCTHTAYSINISYLILNKST